MSPNGHAPSSTSAPVPAPAAAPVAAVPPAAPGAVLVGSFAMAGGQWFGRHRHPVPQLAWARSGVLMVRALGQTWVLPTSTALWIPPGLLHATGAAGPAELRSLYVQPPPPAPDPRRPTRRRTPKRPAEHPTPARRSVPAPTPVPPAVEWTEPTVVAVTPLLRALIDHLADDAPAAPARARAEAVLLDQLTPVSATSVLAPMPRDPRARAVAEALRDTPADARTLAEWSPYAGAAPRTLARLFVAETGMPFGRWRTRLRLQASLPLLAAGATVATAARHVGYASPSAFVAAFHRTVGVPPGAYFPRD